MGQEALTCAIDASAHQETVTHDLRLAVVDRRQIRIRR